MTFPTFLFGSLAALLTGAMFHLVFGGDFKKLILYLVLAWVGFWAGSYFSKTLDWNIFPIGTLNIVMSEIGSILFLLIGLWLSSENQSRKEKGS